MWIIAAGLSWSCLRGRLVGGFGVAVVGLAHIAGATLAITVLVAANAALVVELGRRVRRRRCALRRRVGLPELAEALGREAAAHHDVAGSIAAAAALCPGLEAELTQVSDRLVKGAPVSIAMELLDVGDAEVSVLTAAIELSIMYPASAQLVCVDAARSLRERRLRRRDVATQAAQARASAAVMVALPWLAVGLGVLFGDRGALVNAATAPVLLAGSACSLAGALWSLALVERIEGLQ